MKKNLPFAKAVPPTSERFHLAMEYALDHLEEEKNVKTTTRISLGLALALVLALALAATAFALTNGFGILEYFAAGENEAAPLEGARALVQTELGSVENLGCRVSLAEAVYAGRSVLLLVDVTMPEYVKQGRSTSVGLWHIDAEKGAPCGKFAWRLVREETIEEDLPEGVSYRVYYELLLDEEPPEAIEVLLGVDIDIPENTLSEPRAVGDGAIRIPLDLTVPLRRTQDARTAVFSADAAAAAAAGLEILSVQAQYTDLEAILIIDYAMDGHEAHGDFYGTPFGRFFHADPVCMGMANAAPLESVEGKEPCPVCVANDGMPLAAEQLVADGSPCLHRDAGCALLEGLEPHAPEGAIADIPPCPLCWGLERRVRFHALDAAGAEIADAAEGVFSLLDAALSVDADGRILRRQVIRVQTGEEIPAAILLRVEEITNDSLANYMNGPGETLFDPIPCERR